MLFYFTFHGTISLNIYQDIMKNNLFSLVIVDTRLIREIEVSSCLVKIQPFVGETGVNSPGRKLGRYYIEDLRCSDYTPPLSTVPTKPEGIQGITFGTGFVATVARRLSRLIANFPRCLTPFFFPSGFISIAFSLFAYDHKASEI